MAILKNLDSEYGVSVHYHRITSIAINYKIKKLIICVASYLHKNARFSGALPLDEIDIEVPFEDFDRFLDTNIIYQAYLWLKENTIGFEDAEDDL